MLYNYLKIAIRNIRNDKRYFLINITGLATGIALCILILLFVHHELNYDRYHEKGERIVKVNRSDEENVIGVTPSMVGPVLKENFAEVENYVRIYEPTKYSPVVIRNGENAYRETSFFYADSSFFDLFSHKFILGDSENALSKPKSIVLTKSIAKKLFGNSSPIGKILEAQVFSEIIDFEVTGVIENVPANSHFRFDYLASLSTRAGWSNLHDSELRSSNFYTYLLLNSKGNFENLEEKAAQNILNSIPEQYSFTITFTPLTDVYLRSNVKGFDIAEMGSMTNVIGFTALGILILIIAITNYVNLATARSARRATEVGIRKALGANRKQLVTQFFGESVLVTLISILVALILVEIFKDPFYQVLGKEIDLNFWNESAVWVMLGSIFLVSSLLSGSYPALLLSSYQPGSVLKGVYSKRGSASFLRKGLVVFQFGISIFLIMGTMIIYQQIEFVLNKDLGFDEEEILVFPVGDQQLSQRHSLIKDEINRQTGVISASYISNIPGSVFGGYTIEHTPTEEKVSTFAAAADTSVVSNLGLRLLAGDGFPKSPQYSNKMGYVYLINETLASSFGWDPAEAIGKAVNVLGGREGRVVGVLEDFNFKSLKEKVEPLALFIEPEMYDHLLVKIEGENAASTISSLEVLWEELAPHRPFEVQFLDDQLNSLYHAEEQTRDLFMVFTVLAIFIACLGLLGLSSFTVERRKKEIGIRKVLGATVRSIIGLLSVDFVKLVLIGFVIASPVTWVIMNGWLQNFAYKIEIGIGVFLMSALLATLIAIFTVSWQSVRAATVNPADILKDE